MSREVKGRKAGMLISDELSGGRSPPKTSNLGEDYSVGFYLPDCGYPMLYGRKDRL